MTPIIRLLYIEDDFDDIYMIRKMVKLDTRSHFDFDSANTIGEGCNKLRENTFDAVLVDLHLPDSQGSASVQTLTKEFPDLPIIVVTDSESVELEKDVTEAGAADYIHKEDLSNRLLTRVIRLSIERKQLQLKVAESALKDELTGLYTRQAFYQQLRSAIARVNRTHARLAVAFIDLDKFKTVNDTYGHKIGDALLSHFGQFLNANKRQSDIAARLGGDEFALLISDYTDENSLHAFIERWVKAPPLNIQLDNDATETCLDVVFSIGVKEWHDGMDEDQFIDHADKAMYIDKKAKAATG